MKPILAVTIGDINGIGPEILAKALSHEKLWHACTPLILGCPAAYEAARALVGRGPRVREVSDPQEAVGGRDEVAFLKSDIPAPKRRVGRLDADAGRSAMRWFEEAVALAQAGRVDGIVTCPIQKEGIRLAGYTCSGHTDYLAELTHAKRYWMSLFAGDMRIVHITGHLSLADALKEVRSPRISDAIRAGHDALERLKIGRKKIAVAGLNPHASENGAFGSEEKEEISPAVEICRAEGIDCVGPYPADTIFRRMREGEFDLVVAMYHDQGHIPLKLIAMDSGVNVTLGVPVVRTSVDHGTAYEIAGTGTAREDSLCAATLLAAEFAGGSRS